MRARWILGLSAVLAPGAARADVWSREDPSSGIVSFTNIRPGGKGWKRFTAGPGKAGTVSGTVGTCKSNGGRGA